MKTFMIFAKGSDEAYTSKKFTTEEAARDYIANVLEVEDRKQGIYEEDYYTVEDLSRYM